METPILSFDWSSISAEGSMFAFALVVLVLSCFNKVKTASVFAMFAMAVSLLLEILVTPQVTSITYFNNMLTAGSGFGVFAIACAMLTALMSFGSFSRLNSGARQSDFLAVLMICTAAMMLFVRSNNLMVAFVALECMTVCLYVMAAWSSTKGSSIEAAAKYLVVSGVSGAIFLLGVTFVYGAGLAMDVNLMDFRYFTSGLTSDLFITGMILIVAGVLFKIAAFPFQFWSPDVYQGSPTPVSAFFAVASKAAGIVFLSKIILYVDFSSPALSDINSKAILVLSVIAASTILIGNFAAITQTNVKRLLAMSGIANAGYLLVLLIALLKAKALFDMFEFTLYFYLAAYMFANYALFFVVGQFEGEDNSDQNISDYRGLIHKSPVAASALIINLSSLAGIPPTSGFFGKVLILLMAWYAQLYWLMGIMILGSIISIYYYFAWMRASFDVSTGAERKISPIPALTPTLYALSASTILFGVMLFFWVTV